MKKYIITTLVVLLSLTSYAQIGIGTTNPNTEAALHIDGDKKSLLLPRMTTAQRPTSPAPGLMIFNTSINCVEFWNDSDWVSLCTSCAGEPAQFDFNGLTYKPVESAGQCWLDRNLGATQVAASSTDAAAYGDLYQWGRFTEGHEDRTSTVYTAVETTDGVANFNASGNAWDGQFITRNSGDNNWVDPTVSGVDDLWQGVNGTNNPCPSGYRIPTEAELNAERLSWSSNDSAGAFGSPLKLPVAGNRLRSTGALDDVGSVGYYWSSTVSGSNARGLYFNSSFAFMLTLFRASGISVRCLKD